MNSATPPVQKSSICSANPAPERPAGSSPGTSLLKLAPVFGEHMVFQAGEPIRIWGSGEPGSAVSVSFLGVKAIGSIGQDGCWCVEFPASPEECQPQTLDVCSGQERIVLNDLLIGEVWFCSGQSNMVRGLRISDGGAEESARADWPLMRVLEVRQQLAREPAEGFEGEWKVCTPESAPGISAVAYYFGRDLQAAFGVPVGLIVSAVGGTPIEAWTPRSVLATAEPPYAKATLEATEVVSEQALKSFTETTDAWRARQAALDDARPALAAGWQSRGISPEGWARVNLPAPWEEARIEAVDGAVWFRREICLGEPLRGEMLLGLGIVFERQRIWVNGTELLVAPAFEAARRTVFRLPEGALQPGKNSIAVRVIINGGAGGVLPCEYPLGIYAGRLSSAPEVSLEGEWLCRIEQRFPIEPIPRPAPWEDIFTPGILWNGMIAPLTNFPVRGFIWYQGESNTLRAEEYRTLFPLMITAWRKAWGRERLPFIFVQLAAYYLPRAEPSESTWAELRAAQESALSLPNTAMITAADLGDPYDIHPRNKAPYGIRLARAARTLVYGQLSPRETYSPRLCKVAMSAEGLLCLSFSPAAKLMTADQREVRGVALAGRDRRFARAHAKVEGEQLLVSVPPDTDPAWIRYGWADYPEINLVSESGMPVIPFERAVPERR